MEASAVVALVAMIFQYGVPAVSNAVIAFNKEIVTPEDVEALHALVKRPEEY